MEGQQQQQQDSSNSNRNWHPRRCLRLHPLLPTYLAWDPSLLLVLVVVVGRWDTVLPHLLPLHLHSLCRG